ncbi:MAG: TonB family protein [Thermodesulfobacteriota bacterium]
MSGKGENGNLGIWLLAGVVILVVVAGMVMVARVLLCKDIDTRRQVATVTLLKPPPPPPEVKEKPPEIRKEEPKPEEVVPEEQEEAPENDQPPDEGPPPGEDLGLDADGAAGGDAFGLAARKGGRALVGGGGNLLGRFAWYTAGLSDTIGKRLREALEAAGGIPPGEIKAQIRVVLAEDGRITDFAILKPSGNHRVDAALADCLKAVRVDPPPEGMPRAIRLKVTSHG